MISSGRDGQIPRQHLLLLEHLGDVAVPPSCARLGAEQGLQLQQLSLLPSRLKVSGGIHELAWFGLHLQLQGFCSTWKGNLGPLCLLQTP